MAAPGSRGANLSESRAREHQAAHIASRWSPEPGGAGRSPWRGREPVTAQVGLPEPLNLGGLQVPLGAALPLVTGRIRPSPHVTSLSVPSSDVGSDYCPHRSHRGEHSGYNIAASGRVRRGPSSFWSEVPASPLLGLRQTGPATGGVGPAGCLQVRCPSHVAVLGKGLGITGVLPSQALPRRSRSPAPSLST